MPSGSLVFVLRYKLPANLDIWILPLRQDAYHTTGLCGNYNLNRADDMPAVGYHCTTKCEAHRHELLLPLTLYELLCFQ